MSLRANYITLSAYQGKVHSSVESRRHFVLTLTPDMTLRLVTIVPSSSRGHMNKTGHGRRSAPMKRGGCGRSVFGQDDKSEECYSGGG